MLNEIDVAFIKKCTACGKEYRTKAKRMRYCDQCKEEKKRLRHKSANIEFKKPKTKLSRLPIDIDLITLVRLIDRYNQREGTYYSYGQFMELVRCKKIDLRKEAANAGLSKDEK